MIPAVLGIITGTLVGLYVGISSNKPTSYKEYQMDKLSGLIPDKCPQCYSKHSKKDFLFFVGTNGITCMHCRWNWRPQL